jgi:hypothetical protein
MAASKSPGADELENWHRWFLVKDQDWAPPAALTPDALDKFTDHRIIWLKDAVDLMAFGSEAPASNSDERAVRRQQACRTICMGAGTDKFDVTGCEGLSVGGAGQKIPISYFDLDRRLADQDNRLEVDRERLSDTDFNIHFNAQTEQHWGLWCEVRVEAPRFLKWLRSLLAPKEAGQSNSSATAGILKSDDVIYREWRGTKVRPRPTEMPTAIICARTSRTLRRTGSGRCDANSRRQVGPVRGDARE